MKFDTAVVFFMSDPGTPDTEPHYPGSFVVALSKEEWERDLEVHIALGMAKPGETYSDYIASLHRIFGFVCMGHNHH